MSKPCILIQSPPHTNTQKSCSQKSLPISTITFPEETLLPLTHGLVSRGYRGGVVQDQNFSLKLPGGLWHQLWGDHYHAFPYG